METPPVIQDTTFSQPALPPQQSRGRWWLHLAIIGGYPIVLPLIGSLINKGGERTGPALPPHVSGLLLLVAVEMAIFGGLVALAWLASRATKEQMFFEWKGGWWRPWLLGAGYSIALRILIVVFVIAAVIIGYILGLVNVNDVENMRPKTEALISASSLTGDPVYLLLTLTLVSFVMAGFREELWRVTVFAGLFALFPKLNETIKGRLLVVAIAAVIFGLGHLPQGPVGVALTGVLGFGLGAIIVWHKSIWEAVIAHGFFDASTFFFLYLLATYAPQALPEGLR